MSLLVVGAILLSIILGYKTRINIGLFAIAFAYLIGCFALGLSPKEIIQMWPLKIFFIIFSVSLFYPRFRSQFRNKLLHTVHQEA